jgi:hypothetical protein
MKLVSPAFGLISGTGTTLGLFPHILILCVILITGLPTGSAASLIVFTIGAKALGEWFFWKHCKRRMDSEVDLKNWRMAIRQDLLSHPNVFIGLLMMFGDVVVDAILLYTALKTSIPPIWIFLSLLGCQALGSPIQGVLSDYFSQKKSLLFAVVVGMMVSRLSLEIPLQGKSPDESQFSILNFMGLSFFTVNIQMAFILCCKGLFGNLTVIARAAIAEVVKVETLEKFSKVGIKK